MKDLSVAMDGIVSLHDEANVTQIEELFTLTGWLMLLNQSEIKGQIGSSKTALIQFLVTVK